MDKNTEYEKFTQDIYQTLINAQGIDTIEVQHNVKIQGRSGQKHQIDVYWEYNIGGVNNCVAIECKNYSSEISVGKVRDFYGVLSDIGNINGIMVTKIGYQKGAREYAEHYGINLKELRFPNKDDWKGRIKTINIQMQMIVPHIKNRIPILDNEWVKENLTFDKDDKGQFRLQGMTNEIKIYDSKNNVITDFQQLDDKVPHNWEKSENLEHTYEFEDGFLDVIPFGKVKIKGIKYVYDINAGLNEISIEAEETTKAILKDALNGEIKFFDNKGNIK